MTRSLIRLDSTVRIELDGINTTNHNDYINDYNRTNTNNHEDDDNDNRNSNRWNLLKLEMI